MKIYFLTLSLDSMPWLTHHILQFNQLKFDFEWHVISGVAKPIADTAWVRDVPPRLSRDGSHEYMEELAEHHPRVKYHYATQWPGKTAMLNHALSECKEPGLVFQIDSDELWSAEQIQKIHDLFESNPKFLWSQFYCDYLLGPSIRIVRNGNAYGNNVYEWFRCWRWEPGMKFISHEPPVMQWISHTYDYGFNRDYTDKLGLVFTHPAYALQSQVLLKSDYYNYPGLNAQWLKLQRNLLWPVRVGDFLSHVKDNAIADLICKP
jgi:Glycosyl transferase family 2